MVISGAQPIIHWMTLGWQQGYNPHPLFDVFWYLECYPDVAEAGAHPLVHYIRFGVSEGRDPGPRFNTRWYLGRYPDARADGGNPLAHFLAHGIDQGYRPSPINDTAVAGGTAEGKASDSTQLLPFIPGWDGDWEALIPIATGPADGVLVVDHKPPTPDYDSGSYRMNKILDCLAETGRPLYFVGDHDAHGPEYMQSVRDKGIVTAIGRQQAVTLLMAFGGQLGVVILSRPEITERYLPLVRALAVRARVLYDTVDLHWVRFERGAKVAADGVEMTATAARYKALELANIAATDATIAITAIDRHFSSGAVKHSVLELLASDSRV